MVPVPRWEFHVKRLISHGYKVGVCRQTETRALKATTENANKPFERQLTAVYTSSTWLDDVSAPDCSAEQIVCALVESTKGTLALAAIDVASSMIFYDAWTDDRTRDALHMRLSHLAPREIVLPSKGISDTTRHHVHTYVHGSPDHVRIEEQDTIRFLDTFLHDETLAWAMSELPHIIQNALALLCTHLDTYNMSSVFQRKENYESLASHSFMMLNGTTIEHLELLRNATDHNVKGSLAWLLDKCMSNMGSRLLREWIRRPLIDASAIGARADAVGVLRERRAPVLHKAIALLTKIPDLTRGLSRILHVLVSPNELASILLALHRITQELDEPINTGNALLDATLRDFSSARHEVSTFLKAIHIPEARRNAKDKLYTNAFRYPSIQHWHNVLAADEQALKEHLEEVRRVLKRPSLQYLSVSGVDHLVEVPVNSLRQVPADWARISATKRAVRFHTPTIVQLQKQREQHRESLASVASEAFRDFVAEVSQAYPALRRVVQAVATFDALTSLAHVASRPGYVRPQVHHDGHRLQLTQFRHPVTELYVDTYVPNDARLGGNGEPRGMVFTGSNMGGKSSTVRAMALIVIMAQMGSFVPCEAADISCRDAIYTRMGARDDILRGESTFMVEVRETAHILQAASPRTLVLLDEFGRGTSTFDGVALAYAVLSAMIERGPEMPLLLFITHYVPLTRLADTHPHQLVNVHMSINIMDVEGKSHVVFLHQLKRGAASSSFGVHVAALAGIPEPITQLAHEKARQLENTHKHAERISMYASILKALYQHNTHALELAVQSFSTDFGL